MSQKPFPFIPSGNPEQPDLVYGTGPNPEDGSGSRGFVVALVSGIPVVVLTAYAAILSVVTGEAPGLILSLLGLSALIGSVFAVVGMRQRPRRFRKTALWLTVLPAIAFVVGVLLFMVLVGAMIVANTGG